LGPHSYDPGFSITGVLWIVPIPLDSIQVDPGAGTASMEISNITLSDTFTIDNSFSMMDPFATGVIDSLRVEWAGVTRRVRFSDPVNTFQGLFLQGAARGEVQLRTLPGGAGGTGFTFSSGPLSSSSSSYAEVAQEQNGVFFGG
jgi:hypothetical protein